MGIINVFQGICHSFPYCSFYDNENIMKNSTQLIMAFNSFISSIDPKDQTHLGDFKQLIHLISCEDEDGCHIRIHYIDQNNGVKLKENQNHAKYIKANEKELYVIEPFLNATEEDKLEINLDIFSGDVSIEFLYKLDQQVKYDYIFYGTSEKYIFKTKLIKSIKFNIIAKQYSYYAFSYRNIEPEREISSLGVGGLLLQMIEGRMLSSRIFRFWHNNPTK